MTEIEKYAETLDDSIAESDGSAQIEEPEPAESRFERLLSAIGMLQEQFREKIAVDAHKNALFDEMHRELVQYQNGTLDKIVETMALDVIQLVDSIKRCYRVYEEKEPSEDNYKRLLGVVKGIMEDLTDILYRQSIEAYQVAGEEVDVRRQKILQTVETDEPSKDNLVAARVAEGYEKNGKVIRPERIKIYKYSPGENGKP